MRAVTHNIPALVAVLGLTAGALVLGSPSAAPIVKASPANAAAAMQEIAPGEYQCFYLVQGRILGIGSNRAGELGIGMWAPDPPVPAREIKTPAGVEFRDVAAGGYHSLAVDNTGHVWTWGSDLYGQRGDGGPIDKQGVQTPIINGIPARIAHDSEGKAFDGVVSVVGGWWFDVALKKDGSVWAWGKNVDETSGLAGNGDIATTAINQPTRVPFEPGVSITQIATSGNMMTARDSQGRVWSWGGGAAPKENRGSDSAEFSKPHRIPGLPSIKAIAVGDRFSYALDTDGNLWGWGLCGTFLGLGPAAGGWVPTPTPVKLAFPEFGRHTVAVVAVSAHSTHVILDDGTLWGWGDSAMGEVGNGEIVDFSKHNYAWDWGNWERMVFRPVRIAPEAANFQSLYSNAMCFYTYASARDGKLYSWGRNKTGILGNDVLPTGNTAEHPDSWDVPLATQVSPLTVKVGIAAPSKP